MAGVALVRVQMHFQFRRRRQPDQQAFQHRRAVAVDPQVEAVAVLDAVVGRIRRTHVNVALVTDDAALHADHAGRPEQIAPGESR